MPTYASKVASVPDTTHFAVLAETSYMKDDGYNGYDTKNILDYIVFASMEELERWIIDNNGNRTFKVINVKGVSFELKTTIVVNE